MQRSLSVLSAALLVCLTAAPAAAHGGATGAQDFLQDYGVFIFLAAVLLIGAGVIGWVMVTPKPPSDGETG